MADDVVKRRAYALGKSVVVERGGDPAVLCREIIDKTVDLSRAHALADVGGNMVENGGIQRRASFDGLNLTGCLK